MQYISSLTKPFFDIFTHGVIFCVIMLLTVLIARITQRTLINYYEKSTNFQTGDSTSYIFVRHFMGAAIYACGVALAVYSIPPFRHLSLSFFASSGVFAIVIGFASQHALGNLVSGIFITIFKPFRIGDRIAMPGKEIAGTVEDITLRHTIIKTYENKRIIIPNSLISTEIIENANLIDEKICRFIEIGISYDSDVDLAISIMREEAMKHPDIIDGRDEDQKKNDDPIVVVRVVSFGDSSVNLRAWVWFKDHATAFHMSCEIQKNIKERFDLEGVEIPFPHRTIVYKNKEAGAFNQRHSSN